MKPKDLRSLDGGCNSSKGIASSHLVSTRGATILASSSSGFKSVPQG